MTLYEKNLDFLVSQGFLRNTFVASSEFSNLKLFPGKNGYYSAMKRVGSVEILLHSTYDPVFEAELMLGEGDFSQYRSIFVFGLGLGYHLVKLLERTRSDCLIFVMESDWEIISAAMNVIDFEEILGTHRVVLAFGTPAEIQVILDGVFVMREVIIKLHKMGFLYFAPKYRTDSTWVKQMQQMVLDMFRYQRGAMGNDIGWAVSGLINFTSHLRYIARSPRPTDLENGWVKPVVIVLAGPSLSKNINVLKTWQDKVTIFCVNTVFNRLLDYGITPDATFTLDRAPVIYEKHYQREGPIPESIVYVANPVADHRNAKLFKHHLFILGGGELYQWEIAKAIGSQTLPAGLSVAHFAFIFALHCGATPIILIGQDLALGEEGHTHSSGSMYEELRVDESDPNLVFVEGYNGGQVPSTLTWRAFRDWYEVYLEKNPTFVINATEGGARIRGTVEMSLQEALEKYVGIDSPAKDSLLEWLESKKENIVYSDTMDRIRLSIEERIVKLKVHEQNCDWGLILCNKLSEVNGSENNKTQLLRKILKIVDDIIGGDPWVFSVFRPEYIRLMVEYEEIDDNDDHCITKRVRLLSELFLSLRKFLYKLRQILEKEVFGGNIEVFTEHSLS